MNTKRVRVLVAKPGLDGHDRGALLVARALRNAGLEVVYLGLRQTIPEIVEAAIQEDVDVIGLSVLSGAHLALTRKLMQALRENGASETVVVVGGTIPPLDVPELLAMGVNEVFPVGTDLVSLPGKLRALVEKGLVSHE